MVKLNIGAGDRPLDGYINLDRKRGDEAFPLDPVSPAHLLPRWVRGEVDEIRASHVLEHFSHLEIGSVLADWVSHLRPNGKLKIAVPNLEYIARHYLAGNQIDVQRYAMGAHVDADDRHGVLFDEEALREAMAAAGLALVRPWKGDNGDCSELPVSLNLVGQKTPIELPKIDAVMSVPRLGFMDNFVSSYNQLRRYGIELRRTTGAFWGQCLERGIGKSLAEGAEVILSIDYDTIYDGAALEALLALLVDHPEADAIAPIQQHRKGAEPIASFEDASGKRLTHMPREFFEGPISAPATAHFGLTLLRATGFAKMQKPWFQSIPDPQGGWDDGRQDEDISFWRKWTAAGNTLFLANRVVVGHAELMVIWPDQNFEPIYQRPAEFFESGAPREVWK